MESFQDSKRIQIGCNSSTQVYKALLGGRHCVAVKVLHTSSQGPPGSISEGLKEEIEMLRGMKHGNIVNYMGLAVAVSSCLAMPCQDLQAHPINLNNSEHLNLNYLELTESCAS